MATDKKPTNEELDAKIKKSLDAVDELDKEPSKTTPEKTETDEVVDETPKVEEVVIEEPKDEEPKETDQPVEEPKVEPQETEEEKTYKKRYADSTREAQILHERNKQLNKAVDEASSLPEPTDEEMTVDFPEWEMMDDSQKRMAKQIRLANQRFDLVQKASKAGKDIQEWNDKVDSYLVDPQSLIQTPELEGKLDEFKIFATKDSHRGVDFDVLVKSFLYDAEKSKPKKKGQMFETGVGGPNDKLKSKGDRLSVEEGRTLMKSNYKKYREYLMAGKIDNE